MYRHANGVQEVGHPLQAAKKLEHFIRKVEKQGQKDQIPSVGVEALIAAAQTAIDTIVGF